MLLLIVALPRLYAALVYNTEFAHGDFFPWMVWIATLAVILTLVCVTVNRPSISDPVVSPRKTAGGAIARVTRPLLDRFKRQQSILAFGILPAVIFAILLTLVFWGLAYRRNHSAGARFGPWLVEQWLICLRYCRISESRIPVIWGTLIVFVGWLIATVLVPLRDWRKRFEELLAMLSAGVLTWGLIETLAEYAARISTGSTTPVAFRVGSITRHLPTPTSCSPCQ